MTKDELLNMTIMEFDDLLAREQGTGLPDQIVQRFTKVKDLINKTPKDILKIPRVGFVMVNRLRDTLKTYGLYFKGDAESQKSVADVSTVAPIDMTLEQFQTHLGKSVVTGVPRLRTLTVKALKEAKINTVRELLEYTPRRLIKLQGVKDLSLARLRAFLAENNLYLKCDGPMAYEQLEAEIADEIKNAKPLSGSMYISPDAHLAPPRGRPTWPSQQESHEDDLNAVRETFKHIPNAHEMLLTDFQQLSKAFSKLHKTSPESAESLKKECSTPTNKNVIAIECETGDYLFEAILPPNYVIHDHKLYIYHYESVIFLCDEIYILRTKDKFNEWADSYTFLYWDRAQQKYKSFVMTAQFLGTDFRPNLAGGSLPSLFSRGLSTGELFREENRNHLEYYFRMLQINNLVVSPKLDQQNADTSQADTSQADTSEEENQPSDSELLKRYFAL